MLYKYKLCTLLTYKYKILKDIITGVLEDVDAGGKLQYFTLVTPPRCVLATLHGGKHLV